MASTPVYIDGFEHGVATTAYYSVSSALGGISIVTTPVTGAGARALRCQPAGATQKAWHDLTAAGIIVVRFSIKIATSPSVGSWICEIATATAGQRALLFIDNNLNFKARAGDTGTAQTYNQNAGKASLNTVYVVDLRYNPSGSTNNTLDWTVNGVTQTQATFTAAATANCNHSSLGYEGASVVGDASFDNWFISATNGDFPMTDCDDVIALSPAAVGVHNLDASTSAYFFDHNGTSPTAITSSETTSYQELDEIPMDGGTDRVQITGGTPTSSYIDPSADGANNAWTKSTGTAAFSLLDDAVRQPTAPTTGSDMIHSQTDEQLSDLVFPDTLTWHSGDTFMLWVYGIGGTKRALDVQISNDDGSTWQTRQTNVVGAGAAAAWHSLDISAWVTSQTQLNQLRARLICNSTAGGGATDIEIDAVYVEQQVPQLPATTNYLEYDLQATPDVKEVNFVNFITAYRNDSGTTANKISAKVYDGGGAPSEPSTNLTSLYTDVNINTATLTFRRDILTTKPSGGAWTAVAADGLKLRWGYTSDPDSTPRLDAFMAEVVLSPNAFIAAVHPPQIHVVGQAVARSVSR
jgi:hypothetical protein